MKKVAYFLVIFAFVLLTLSIWISSVYSNQYLQEKTFYASANFTYNHLGFDVSNSSLNFGYIPIGSSSTREVVYFNHYDLPVYVYIEAEGELSDSLIFESPVFVEGKSERVISFTAFAPRDSMPGFYDGSVRFIIKPAK